MDNINITQTNKNGSNEVNINLDKTISKKELKEKLLSYYQNNFKNISLLENQKNIEEIFVNLAIIKEESKKEQEEQNKELISRQDIIYSYEEIYKPKEPIEVKELIKKAKRGDGSKALIFGKAGIGKTTLCKYISYHWANEKLYNEFDLIIYVALREWEDGGIAKAIKTNYFGEDEKKEIEINEIKDKALFLFDGYDELKENKKKLLQREIRNYNLQNYIITSRPYGYTKGELDINEEFETIGFTKENVEEYIDKFFKDDKEKAKNLKEYLKNNINIKQISYIPLMIEMICSLHNQKTLSSSLTMTDLYKEIKNYLLNKYVSKKGDPRVYLRRNRKKIEKLLGKIAFEALKRQKILFDGELIEEILEEDEIEFFERNIIYAGFLKTDREYKDILDRKFEFIHLTFQEFFAALYVSTLSKEEISKIIQEYKFYPYMQVFFAFLAGIFEDKEFLLDKIKKEPKDILGFYKLIFTLNLLREIKKGELNQSVVNDINNSLEKWLKTTIKEEKHYEIVLDKIKSISQFLNDKFVDTLIDVIKDESINYWVRGYVVDSLSNFGRNDDKFVDTLIDVIKDESIDSDVRGYVAYSLSKLGRNDDKVVDTLIDFIKDESIDSDVRGDVAESLSNLGRNDDKVVDKLIDFIKDESIDSSVRGDVAESLSNLGRNDDKFVYALIDFIKDESINLEIRVNVAESLSKLTYQNISILKKIDITKYFPNIFTRYISIEALFKAYDENLIPNLIPLDVIIKNAFYNTLPLYIKEGKLCTIFENREIKIERDVDEEFFCTPNLLS